MVFASASIAVVWAVLLGTAWFTSKVGLSRRNSAIVVSVEYVALASLTLLWLGHGWRGLAAITGMVLPYAIALTLVAIVSDPADHTRRTLPK